MEIIGRKTLHDFKVRHADACATLNSWEAEVSATIWKTPQDIKKRYSKASILPGNHVIFDVCGNRYRLWVQIAYKKEVVLIKKIGTHKEYDKWQIK